VASLAFGERNPLLLKGGDGPSRQRSQTWVGISSNKEKVVVRHRGGEKKGNECPVEFQNNPRRGPEKNGSVVFRRGGERGNPLSAYF